MAAFAYGVYDRSRATGGALVAAAFAVDVAHLPLGYLIRRWWTLLLPPAGVLIAIPAGYPNGVGGEPFPVAVTMALLVGIPGLVLLAAGVALGRLLDRAAAARRSL